MNSRGRRVEARKAERGATERKSVGKALPDEELRQRAKLAPSEWQELNRAQKRAAAKTS